MDYLKEYCNRFKGIKRVFKTVQAAILSKTPDIEQQLELALEFAEQDNILKINRYIENTALEWNAQVGLFKKGAANLQFKPYQQLADNLERNIHTYKNQQNKLQTGLCYIELGNLYLKAGDVTEAFLSYEKVFNYYDSGNSLDYLLQWSATMLIERRYVQLRSIAPKDAIPTVGKKRREQYTTLLIFQALCCLYQGDIGEFLKVISSRISPDSVVEEENLLLVSSLREIGIFVTVCSLAMLSREEVQDILTNDSVRLFVTQDKECLGILEAYIRLDYKQIITKITPLFIEFAQEFIFRNYSLYININEKLLRQYLYPYKKISMNNLVETFNLNRELALEHVKRLIQYNQINFLYDPIEDMLVQKVTEKIKKNNTYKEAVRTITSFLRNKQLDMVRYQLSIVDHENNAINKLELKEGQEFQNFKQLEMFLGNVF